MEETITPADVTKHSGVLGKRFHASGAKNTGRKLLCAVRATITRLSKLCIRVAGFAVDVERFRQMAEGRSTRTVHEPVRSTQLDRRPSPYHYPNMITHRYAFAFFFTATRHHGPRGAIA